MEFVKADDAAKRPHADVDYGPSAGRDRCGGCAHFQAGPHCELVDDPIDADGWCKLFQAATANDGLAFDRASVRSYDKDGGLHVALTNISKANVCEYLGAEIPDWQQLGLDPARRYRLYRDPEELAKGAATFNNKPLLSRHVPVTADSHQPDLVIGSTGTDAVFAAPYLRNSLVVWARSAIDDVESGAKRELSSAYRYRADMTAGRTPDGEAFDGVMRDIVGNHVAIVKEGRAGADVVVGDSREILMSAKALSRQAAVAHGALLVYLAPKLAQDAKLDLGPVLAGLTAKNFKQKKPAIVAGIKTALAGKLAADANLDDVEKVMEMLEKHDVTEEAVDDLPEADVGKTMDADGLSPEEEAQYQALLKRRKPAAADAESDDDKKKREAEEAKKKAAEDEEKKDMVTKPAMDAAIAAAVAKATKDATATQQAIRDAERTVRPYVGDLAMAHDSAEGVYRTALTTLGVDGAKIKGLPVTALQVILEAQPQPGAKKHEPAIAMDAAQNADFAKRFPGAARIKHV